MEIKTKLNIGDSIFFIHQKSVIESVVRGIDIRVSSAGNLITYLCNKSEDAQVSIKSPEDYSYPTKESLQLRI